MFGRPVWLWTLLGLQVIVRLLWRKKGFKSRTIAVGPDAATICNHGFSSIAQDTELKGTSVYVVAPLICCD
uniref:Uncharacterized protein n=1 Tax=Arundo donax TaxID=35708 RepID=A0A0A9B9N7_ARUDO